MDFDGSLEADHRPYPAPDGPWVLSMEWHDVLFLHWRVPVKTLQPHIPEPLEILTHDGSAWLGIVPFRMSGIRPRFLPSLPAISTFPELNIRTYVTDGTRPGVWFHSLDASSSLAVQIARWTFSLPYFRAEMSVTKDGDQIDYTSARDDREPGQFSFEAQYEPTKPLGDCRGSLEDFLVENYCLYSATEDGRIYRGEIHHPRWELHRADCRIDSMSIRNHPSPPERNPDSVLYAPHSRVVAWFPKQVH